MKPKKIKYFIFIIFLIFSINIIQSSLAKYVYKLDIAELSLEVKFNTTLIAVNADASVNAGYVQTQMSNGSFENFEIIEEMNGWSKATANDWKTTSEHFEVAHNGKAGEAPYQYKENSPYGDYFIEMNAETADIYYQDLTTNSNDVIQWSLMHTTRNTENVYSEEQNMAVIIGEPNGTPTKEEVIEEEVVTEVFIDEAINEESKARWEANGLVEGSSYGYAVPEECSALSLVKGSNWEEARGVYVIPKGQTTTRFSFLAVTEGAQGNLLDNVYFTTLLGNVKIIQNKEEGKFTITGYWDCSADKNLNKNLVYYIKDMEGNNIINGIIDMSKLTTNHFKIEFNRDFDEDVQMYVYHEDYQNF